MTLGKKEGRKGKADVALVTALVLSACMLYRVFNLFVAE